MITVEAHTGSTKSGTYKVVTGVIVEYVRRSLGSSHYTLDVVIIDADGVTYQTGKGRIIREVPAEVEAERETVWVPVTGGDEIELTWAQIWDIHMSFTAYRNLVRSGEQYAAMRVLRELKGKGYGLAHREYRDVTNWNNAPKHK